MCCESILFSHWSKVHRDTSSSCWVICSYWLCLCLISVLLLLAAALWSVASGTAFVSSHPLLYQPRPILSQAVGLLSLRRVKLEAKLNRWAAVSGEWNFSPTGIRKAVLGGGEERIGVSGGRSVQSAFYELKISCWKVTEMRQWHRSQEREPKHKRDLLLLQWLKSGSFTDVERSCFSSEMRESPEIKVFPTLTESLSP